MFPRVWLEQEVKEEPMDEAGSPQRGPCRPRWGRGDTCFYIKSHEKWETAQMFQLGGGHKHTALLFLENPSSYNLEERGDET